ncbi:MAG: hypothetical protein KDC66_06365 [Phaeodactylibacter sp.]|nr:hypothetical protein [Phaeodactylibacter sp.]MCB9275134.1 hypothetical protein [Lewinellaceae bacterium]
MREVLLFIHFIGLAMGLGTSLAFMFLGMASAKMEKAEALKFRLNTLALSRMGHIGLALLLASGIALMTPHWSELASMPLLMAKLALVIVLGALIGMISSVGKKVKMGGADSEAHFKKLETLGKVALLTSLAIVVLAVTVFH